jgi:2-methylisoborneol synthase
LFVGYCQEASWRATDRMPPVWEYLVNRQLNSFLPCITLVDAVAGYRLPAEEYSDPRVRGTLKLAGLASTLVNDIYSMNREQGSGGVEYNLPAVIAAEEHCSLEEGLRQSIAIHDDLVRTYESEASALCLSASPALQRFLGSVWAWLGGNRQWHSDSGRYE